MSRWSFAVTALVLAWSAAVGASQGDPRFPAMDDEKKVEKDCTFGGKKLYGKVKIVESFPDFKIKAVDSFPDLKVKLVESFPDECGKWKMVESFPDFTIKYVDSFPDFTIKHVESFPGLP